MTLKWPLRVSCEKPSGQFFVRFRTVVARVLLTFRRTITGCCYHYIYCHSHSYILYIISYIRQSPFSLFVINIFIFTIIIIILSLAHIKQSPFGQMTKGWNSSLQRRRGSRFKWKFDSFILDFARVHILGEKRRSKEMSSPRLRSSDSQKRAARTAEITENDFFSIV